jgi:hypothetical protein
MPNAGGTGYYRFDLPAADWDALIASADQLSGNEALAVADSLRASYLAGRASVAQLAALARNLSRNPDSHASTVALEGLETLRGAGLFDAVALQSYRRFVLKTYQPLSHHLGVDFRTGAYAAEDPEQTQRRIAMIDALAGAGRDKQTITKLRKAAEAFLAGDPSALDPMWYDQALSLWLEGRGVDGAKDLFARALASQDPTLRPILLGTIGGSGNKAIGAWVIDKAKDEQLRASERLSLLRGVIASSGTRTLGYEWMKGHLDDLLSGSGGIFFASRLPQMVAGFCSIERADSLAADLGPRLAGTAAELELKRAVERVRDCGILQQSRKAEASRDMQKLR